MKVLIVSALLICGSVVAQAQVQVRKRRRVVSFESVKKKVFPLMWTSTSELNINRVRVVEDAVVKKANFLYLVCFA